MKQTEIEFRNSQALRTELGQILQNPTLLKALDTIRSSPDEFPPPNPSIHYDVVLAREMAKTVGVNSAIKKLHNLTEKIESNEVIKDASERPEWQDGMEESVPAFAKEAFKKLQEQR